ncbi:integrator complex subunit 7-like [Ptychodera flava]|uniref:integrator complex subunit 7-like n=1 Tax=Ptychodera flava TaxID=63121 RepID=UPI003969ED23
MATVSARLSMMGMESTYGEPEQDANTALMELDKGLRSAKVGEQCEAIVRFPRLFEKYPFPILINSAFLKLSEVFRLGSNFLRLCVLKVTQQSEKQLDKILNKDEFVRRIFTVIHTNDPVARAITLRVLGSIAAIIADRKNVHYSIRNSLDSHDAVELEAAIFAANRFAAESKDFAVGICNKIADMMQGLATPVEVKLKLIHIFEHMHHDAESAVKVRQLCISMLPSYPAKSFVITTLHSLSKLAAASLMDIPAQVVLLLSYLNTDPRKSVKTLALQDLRMLATKAPHMWTSENIETLCHFTAQNSHDALKIGAMKVLSTLSRSVAFSIINLEQGSVVMDLCSQCSYHNNPTVAALTLDVMTNIVVTTASKGRDVAESSQEVAMAMEALIISCASSGSKQGLNGLKTVLCCASQLCKSSSAAAEMLVEGIATTLTTAIGEVAILLCQSLAAIGTYQPEVLATLTSDIMDMFKEVSQNVTDKDEENLMVYLATILLLATKGSPDVQLSKVVIDQLLGSSRFWLVFKGARQAARQGNHRVAAELFGSLTTKVASEHFYFWLNSLKSFCEGEECLRNLSSTPNQTIHSIQKSIIHYEKGIATLKAAVTPTYPLDFQCKYVKLRCEMLGLHSLLAVTCQTIKTCPPPAIAPAVAMATGQDLQKCGRLATQMQHCYESFQALANQFSNFQKASFDADPATLENMELLQQTCLLMVYAIDTLILSNKMYSNKLSNQIDMFSSDNQSGPTRHGNQMVKTCQQVMTSILEVLEKTNGASVSQLHTECLSKASLEILRVPLGFPRYFFQSLQSTSIKLALSPTPRNPGEPVPIQNDTHLALKIEGVVQHGNRPGLFRKVKEVCLTVSSVCIARIQKPHDTMKADLSTNEMKQTVDPRNDYFSVQFLLVFPIPGTHNVTVTASVIDEHGVMWKTGPKTSILIKSYEDAFQQRQQQQQQQQAMQQRSTFQRF